MSFRTKKVSVVIPNYNYAKYIRKRIWSVMRQSYPIFELIVLDDGSTDGSVEIIREELREVNERFPRVKTKLIVNRKNSGKAVLQWRKGFEEARGEFVWIAEADDLSRRDFLETAMRGFEDPGVVMSYTESRIINGIGLMIAPNFRWSRDREKTGRYKHDYIKEGVDEIREIMAIRCSIPNVSAVVFRKEAVDYGRILSEATKFRQVGDWYFYIRVLERGKISYNRRALNKFRVHGGSATGRTKGSEVQLLEVREMHEMVAREFHLGERVIGAMKAEEVRIAKKYGIIE